MNFIACPTENIHLQGRFDGYPIGFGNLMNVLDADIHICQMMSIPEIENALDLITINGARTMHILERYGIEIGKPTNFIVLNAKSSFAAVCDHVAVACSVRDGNFLFQRQETVTTDRPLLQ